MTGARLVHIVRHPIKSVGFQEIKRAALTEGRPFPHDRVWAIATEALQTPDSTIDWQRKMAFVRGAAEGTLQAIRIAFDPDSGAVTLTHPQRPDFVGTLPRDGAALVDWVRPLWPTSSRPPATRLVQRGDGGALSDQKQPYVSLLNLASLRSLQDAMGQPLSIHRFRGNLWVDGLDAWSEFDMIGKTLTIGEAELRIDARITRCVATTVNPASGHADGDTLAALERGWGHKDLGVFATVTRSGTISTGDSVELCA